MRLLNSLCSFSIRVYLTIADISHVWFCSITTFSPNEQSTRPKYPGKKDLKAIFKRKSAREEANGTWITNDIGPDSGERFGEKGSNTCLPRLPLGRMAHKIYVNFLLQPKEHNNSDAGLSTEALSTRTRVFSKTEPIFFYPNAATVHT